MRKYPGVILMLLLSVVLVLHLSACQKKAPTPVPVPTEISIFNTGNIDAVINQPTNPAVFTISETYKITYISDYHFLSKGSPPGTITLTHADGTVYGPWQATGIPGQDEVPNAFWVVKPNIVIKPGTYTIEDSNPATWSQNNQSGNRGFTDVRGYKSL
ncbi:MAG TPA: hypothetical protein VN426_11700 [Syntrophomonadaceae bacterium]|nr:hypothetical protein [Syntrophomonadaceae bacterium]